MSLKYNPLIAQRVNGEEMSGAVEANIALVEDLRQTMKFGSLCALGGFAPYPVSSALHHFPEDFRKRSIAAAAE